MFSVTARASSQPASPASPARCGRRDRLARRGRLPHLGRRGGRGRWPRRPAARRAATRAALVLRRDRLRHPRGRRLPPRGRPGGPRPHRRRCPGGGTGWRRATLRCSQRCSQDRW